MRLKIFGAVIGVALLSLVAPASAATFDGTTIVNGGGSISAGDPALNFSVDPANGIKGDDFTTGQHYFDYIVSFTLTGPANLTIASNPTVGTNLKDYHTALFAPQPSATGMFFDSHSGLNINLLGALTPLATGDTTLNSLNLASGNYFLHLFGVIAGNSSKNSVLTALSGSFTAAAVAATPIPPALLLFGSALGGLGFAGWRRKHRVA